MDGGAAPTREHFGQSLGDELGYGIEHLLDDAALDGAGIADFAPAKCRNGSFPASAEGLGAVILLSGVVGSLVGGWLADKVLGVRSTFLLACLLEAAGLALAPFVPLDALWLPASLIGASTIAAFVTWIGLPGLMAERLRAADVPTAAGLRLTIGAAGGVLLPPAYSVVAGLDGAAAAWLGLAACTIVFATIALFARTADSVAETRRALI